MYSNKAIRAYIHKYFNLTKDCRLLLLPGKGLSASFQSNPFIIKYPSMDQRSVPIQKVPAQFIGLG